MRELLTGLGLLICAVLIAAMAGPHFVDWGQYRGLIATEITRATGMPAVIDGRVGVTLLPTPSLTVEQVRLGAPDPQGFRMAEIERVAVALAPTALLRGTFVVTEAYVDAPVVRWRGAAPGAGEGALALSPEKADLVVIERLAIRDGVIHHTGQDGTVRSITAVGLELEATSLAGPAKGSGSFQIGDKNRQFRFALGKLENGRIRTKGVLEDVSAALRLELDGSLQVMGTEAALYDGTVSLTGNPVIPDGSARGTHVPFRVQAKTSLKAGVLALNDLTLVIEADDHPHTLQGEGKVILGDQPRYDISLAARSFDFDRPGPDGQPRRIVPAEALAQLAAMMPGSSDGALPPGKVELAIGGVIVGGQTIIGATGIIESRADGARLVALEGEFPGQTRLRFRDAGVPSKGLLSGVLEVESRDPERLAGWFAGKPLVNTAAVALKIGASVRSVEAGAVFENVSIARGETVLSGEGTLLLAVPGIRPSPRVSARLRSPRFRIADVPALSPGGDTRTDGQVFDFDIDLEADKLVFEGRETGRLTAKARRDGAILSIERIAVTELDGGNLVASGTFGGGSRRLVVKLEADRVEGLAALAERLLPGGLAPALRARSRLISPALLVATIADTEDGTFSISANGALAGTRVAATGSLVGKNDLTLDLDVNADAPDSAALLRQMTGAGGSGPALAPGGLHFRMKGNPRAALGTTVDVKLAGAEARIDGTLRIFQPFAPFEGKITVRSGDIQTLLGASGADVPAVSAGTPLTLSGGVESNLERITITDLKADIGGTQATGEIAFNLIEGGKVAGQLRLPHFDFRPVAAMAFGTTRPFVGTGNWNSEPFGRALLPFLTGDLWIDAAKARLDESTVFDRSRFVLRFDKSAASIEYADIAYRGARIVGEVVMRRAGETGSLATRIKVAGLKVDSLAADGIRGEAEADIQLAGQGTSPARLVAALSGSGALRIVGGLVPGYDPAALSRVLSTPAHVLGPLERLNLTRKLEAELNRGSGAIPDAVMPLLFVNGVGRISSVAFEQGKARHEATGSLDLGTLSLDLKVTSTANDVPAEWRGARPQIATTWRGPLSAPVRSIAVDSLMNGYLAMAIARDLDRTEIIEQDIRERAFFNRRLKASIQQRIWAEEQAKADQTRLEAELLARRTEEEAAERAASEERERRIRALIQQGEPSAPVTVPVPAPAPATGAVPAQPGAPPVARRPAAPSLPPPINLMPPGTQRPRAATPVEVMPLDPPAR